ncbi:MAG: 3-dehydro-L-gulonate 2-dehydrogenase [Synergistaceae bacterium]|jgi:3-dehydro-L-gulonate 2-dehydrogenase|nr:3-dehydro-L-gulonate 2-dehydrogenase [Synergistaceae bacterium]
MRVKYGEMKALFTDILTRHGFSPEKAEKVAGIFTDNSCDGVYSHGLNRFPRFLSYVKKGHVDPAAEPALEESFGAFERWNGNMGVGCTNAVAGMEAAMALARRHGIGCVAMGHTNHWMRGGSYGLQAARAGFAGICWTNANPSMPPWGAKTPKVGNNPLVMAFPYKDVCFLIDGALSQYSNGALDGYRMAGARLPFPGGYDKDGKLTTDPGAILETGRALPIGFWKGSGYSLLLDAIGAALSRGSTVPEIGRASGEIGVTQVFIAFDLAKVSGEEYVAAMAERLIADFKTAEPAESGVPFHYPGEKSAATRKENLASGIPVNEEIWNDVLKMKG